MNSEGRSTADHIEARVSDNDQMLNVLNDTNPKRNQRHGNLQKKDIDEEEESKFTYEKGLLEVLEDTSQDDQGLKKNEISKPDDMSLLFDEPKVKYSRELREQGKNLINLVTDGNYGEALKYLEEACLLDPGDYENHRSKIDMLFRIGKYTEVIRCCDQLLASGKAKPDIHAWRGLSQVRLGKKKQARDYFDQALSTESSEVKFSDLGIKAQTQAYLGKATEALKTADEALQKDPCDATFHYSKGIVFLQQEKYEEALKCAEEAIKLNKNYSEANYCKGSALLNLGKYTEAIESLDQAISLNGTNHRYYVARSCARQGLFQKDLSAKDNEKAAELCQDDPVVLNNLADSQNFSHKFEEAFKNINKAIELEPDNSFFYCNKGEFKLNAGEKEEALECFNKALKLGGSKHIYFWRGNCLLSMNRIEEAVADYTKVQELRDAQQFGFNHFISHNEMADMDEFVDSYRKNKNINHHEG